MSVEEEKHEEDEYLFMASQDLNSHELNTWIIDSGCTKHMTKYISIFTSIDKSIQPKIKLANGNIVKVKGKGTIFMSTKKGLIIVKDVLYIPDLCQNLLSVLQLLRNGYGVSFMKDYCFIFDEHGDKMKKIEKIEKIGNNFYLRFDLVEDRDFNVKVDVWHEIFAQVNLKPLKIGGDNLNGYGDNDLCDVPGTDEGGEWSPVHET